MNSNGSSNIVGGGSFNTGDTASSNSIDSYIGSSYNNNNSNNSSLERWAYIMIIIVCFAILSLIFFYLIILLIRSRRRRCCSKRQESKYDAANEDNKTSLSINNTAAASRICCTNTQHQIDEENNITENDCTKCAQCSKFLITMNEIDINNNNNNNSNKASGSSVNFIRNSNNNIFDRNQQNFTSKNTQPYHQNSSSMLSSGSNQIGMSNNQQTPGGSNLLTQFMNRIKLSFFDGKSSSEPKLSSNGGSSCPSSPRPQSALRNNDTDATLTSIMKRPSISVASGRKASLAATSTTGTVHSVKFKTATNSGPGSGSMRRKKKTKKTSRVGALFRSYTTATSSSSDCDEEDDYDLQSRNECKKDSIVSDLNNFMANKRYTPKSMLTTSRDTLNTQSASIKKSSQQDACSDYYSSRKNSTNSSSCWESSVVDLYRQQKRYSTTTNDTNVSSSQFTNSIISSSSSWKTATQSRLSPNMVNMIDPIGLRTVTLEQQPDHNQLGLHLMATSPRRESRNRKYSMVVMSSTGKPENWLAPSGTCAIVNNPDDLYDKFWVPPEIARLANLNKQRASLPNTNSSGAQCGEISDSLLASIQQHRSHQNNQDSAEMMKIESSAAMSSIQSNNSPKSFEIESGNSSVASTTTTTTTMTTATGPGYSIGQHGGSFRRESRNSPSPQHQLLQLQQSSSFNTNNLANNNTNATSIAANNNGLRNPSLTNTNNLMNAMPSISAGGGATTSRRRASMFDPIDPAELQKTLYQSLKNTNISNNSQTTDQSNGGPSLNGNQVIGTVEFGIQYLIDTQSLCVDVLRVFDLKSNGGDIYCKCSLMPDKVGHQTKLIKTNNSSSNGSNHHSGNGSNGSSGNNNGSNVVHSSDLVFEDQFRFDGLDMAKLETRYVEIALHELMDSRGAKDECIGVAMLKLNYSNIETKKIFLKDFRAPSKSEDDENYVGDLMFSLAYLPTAERLTIVVMKARNLIHVGGESSSRVPDSYVKVSLVSKKDPSKKLKKKKTSTQKATLNPVFNEEVVFTHLKKEQLNEILIEFAVYHDSMTSKEMLGCFTISSDSKGNSSVQWRDMLNGKKSIAWWHKLISQDELLSPSSSSPNNTAVNGVVHAPLDNGGASSDTHNSSLGQIRRHVSGKHKGINLSSLKIKPFTNMLNNSEKSKQNNLSD